MGGDGRLWCWWFGILIGWCWLMCVMRSSESFGAKASFVGQAAMAVEFARLPSVRMTGVSGRLPVGVFPSARVQCLVVHCVPVRLIHGSAVCTACFAALIWSCWFLVLPCSAGWPPIAQTLRFWLSVCVVIVIAGMFACVSWWPKRGRMVFEFGCGSRTMVMWSGLRCMIVVGSVVVGRLLAACASVQALASCSLPSPAVKMNVVAVIVSGWLSMVVVWRVAVLEFWSMVKCGWVAGLVWMMGELVLRFASAWVSDAGSMTVSATS